MHADRQRELLALAVERIEATVVELEMPGGAEGHHTAGTELLRPADLLDGALHVGQRHGGDPADAPVAVTALPGDPLVVRAA